MVLDETINNPKRGFDVAALPQTTMFPPEDDPSECIPPDEYPQLALTPQGNDSSPGWQDEGPPFILFGDDDMDEDDMGDDESFDDMDDFDDDDDFEDDDVFEDEDEDYEDEDEDFDYEEDVDYDDFDE